MTQVLSPNLSPPDTTTPPEIVGLTGGIASGKTTVSNMIQAQGIPVIDADLIAREVVAPKSEGLQELVNTFSEDILTPHHSLDRKKLRAFIFTHPQARQKVNNILHPRIQTAMLNQAQKLWNQGHRTIVYDAALLIETGSHKMVDQLWVVSVPRSIQLQRLMKRDKISAKEASKIIDAQMPLEQKVALATHVIDNSKDLSNTQKQVDALLSPLLASNTHPY